MGGWFSGWCYSYWVNAEAVCKQEVGDTVWLEDLLSKSSDIQGVCSSFGTFSTGWVVFICSWAEHFQKQNYRGIFKVTFYGNNNPESPGHFWSWTGISTLRRHFLKTEVLYSCILHSPSTGSWGLWVGPLHEILFRKRYVFGFFLYSAGHQESCWHSWGVLNDHEKQVPYGHHALWGANLVL